jgi:hypothetical protein
MHSAKQARVRSAPTSTAASVDKATPSESPIEDRRPATTDFQNLASLAGTSARTVAQRAARDAVQLGARSGTFRAQMAPIRRGQMQPDCAPGQNTTAQLAKRPVVADGITHLVRLNGEGSLYQPNFMDNEVAETKPGDAIILEDGDLLRSRRGANQEQDPQRDEDHERDQLWIRAELFNRQPLPANSYMRSGTFTEGVPPVRKKQPESGSSASLLLPYAVPANDKVFMIDASHRGDMYHLRAAMSVEKIPVIIFNCSGDNDLSNYLSNAPDAQVYKIPYNPARPREEDHVEGLVYRSVDVLSESDATQLVAKKPKAAAKISASMTNVPERCMPFIVDSVGKIFGKCGSGSALLMFRDSGEKSLVYPELDSGAALPQLAKLIGQKGFSPVVCGTEQDLGIPTIGAYWKYLDGIPEAAGIRERPEKLKRDIEAEFMRQAFKAGKFSIAVGFRSGALDLFTFLGIPTISISLKDIVGEDRHGKFVGDKNWKRTNIQYDIPRSDVTRLMAGRGESALYMSPYWKMRGGDPSSDHLEERPKKAAPPDGFHGADLDTVSKGLDVGLDKARRNPALETLPVSGVVSRENVMFELPALLRKVGATPELEAAMQKDHIVPLFQRRIEEAMYARKLALKAKLTTLPQTEAEELSKSADESLDKMRAAYEAEAKKILKARTDGAAKRAEGQAKKKLAASATSVVTTTE